MPQHVAFADNSHLARNKTPKPRITKRVKDAIDAIVERGIAYNEAAAESGLTTRAMRLALERPHVLQYTLSYTVHEILAAWAQQQQRKQGQEAAEARRGG